MIKKLGKQFAIALLAISLAGGAGADTVAEVTPTFREGMAAYEAGDYALALSKFRKAAEAGDANAQYFLGRLHYLGAGGLPQNDTEAVKWFLRAADQSNVDAQEYLGFMHGHGIGVQQNYVESVKWHLLAAENEKAYSDAELRKLLRLNKVIEANFECHRFSEVVRLYNEDSEITRDYELKHWRLGLEAAREQWDLVLPVMLASEDSSNSLLREVQLSGDFNAGSKQAEHHSKADKAISDMCEDENFCLIDEKTSAALSLYRARNCELLLGD